MVELIVGRLISGAAVELACQGGRIVDVRNVDSLVTLPYITPGLVDLQVNGFAGFDMNGPDVVTDSVVEMRKALQGVGTGWFVPTVVTASHGDIRRSLRAIAEAREADPATREAIPYVHLEGPCISSVDGPRGAHDSAHIRSPDLDEFAAFQRAAMGIIGMVTLSPHYVGVSSYIRALVAMGIRVSIGHTDATPAQVRGAVDAGARFSTHLGNGISSVLPRHPNIIWAQLADDRLTAGFIADGHHLPLDTLKAMLKAKGPDRCFVVSDSVALAGSPPGVYESPIGGSVELREDGSLRVAGTPYLAGAALPLAACFGILARAGIPLGLAVRLAVDNPAGIAGVDARLAPGCPAVVHSVAVPTAHVGV